MDTLNLYYVYQVSKTYNVAGSQIYISIRNTDLQYADVKIGIYMTT
jgi:hypothetical protein